MQELASGEATNSLLHLARLGDARRVPRRQLVVSFLLCATEAKRVLDVVGAERLKLGSCRRRPDRDGDVASSAVILQLVFGAGLLLSQRRAEVFVADVELLPIAHGLARAQALRLPAGPRAPVERGSVAARTG